MCTTQSIKFTLSHLQNAWFMAFNLLGRFNMTCVTNGATVLTLKVSNTLALVSSFEELIFLENEDAITYDRKPDDALWSTRFTVAADLVNKFRKRLPNISREQII